MACAESWRICCLRVSFADPERFPHSLLHAKNRLPQGKLLEHPVAKLARGLLEPPLVGELAVANAFEHPLHRLFQVDPEELNAARDRTVLAGLRVLAELTGQPGLRDALTDVTKLAGQVNLQKDGLARIARLQQ